MILLADVIRRHWSSYSNNFGGRIPPSHKAAVRAILACRTAALGGHLYRCDCGREHFAYHSCGHRACCQCGHQDTTQWIERQSLRLLPVPYFLVTFTVPETLRAIIRSHQKLLYHQLFAQSSATLLEVGLSKLGIELGLLGVLHTWTRQLIFHPHIHYVVPGGGLTPDGLRWKRVVDAEFFIHGDVLAARFKNRLRQYLEDNQQELLKQVPAKTWQQKWVVDVKAVGSGQPVLKYLAAYVHRTALGPHRLVALDDSHVSFKYRDRDDGQLKTATVSGQEFLRRFLQHVLPAGFQRVRNFGWLSPAAKQRWTRIHTLLDRSPQAPLPPSVLHQPACPSCQKPMVRVGKLPRGPPHLFLLSLRLARTP